MISGALLPATAVDGTIVSLFGTTKNSGACDDKYNKATSAKYTDRQMNTARKLVISRARNISRKLHMLSLIFPIFVTVVYASVKIPA